MYNLNIYRIEPQQITSPASDSVLDYQLKSFRLCRVNNRNMVPLQQFYNTKGSNDFEICNIPNLDELFVKFFSQNSSC